MVSLFYCGHFVTEPLAIPSGIAEVLQVVTATRADLAQNRGSSPYLPTAFAVGVFFCALGTRTHLNNNAVTGVQRFPFLLAKRRCPTAEQTRNLPQRGKFRFRILGGYKPAA